MDYDDAFAAGVAFVLEELGERHARPGFDDVREQLPAEANLLRLSVVGQVQQHRVKRVEIDLVGVPAGVEVAGLVLSGDEAAVQPDLPATGVGEQLDRLSETIQ